MNQSINDYNPIKGIKYLDDKLSTIEKILNIQNYLLINKKTLLNFVKPKFRAELKEMIEK